MRYALSFSAIMALTKRELLRSRRFFGLELLSPALMGILFIYIFKLAVGGNIDAQQLGGLPMLEFIAAGFIGLSMMQFSFYASGYSLMFDKMERMIEDLLTAPLNGLEIAAGYMLAALLRGIMVSISVMIVMGFLVGLHIQQIGLLFLFLILGGVGLSALSLICCIYSHKWDSLAAKESFLVIPLLQLSGAFFPMSALESPIWRMIMGLNPIYYVIDGVRHAVTGIGEMPLLHDLLVSVCFMVFCVLVASWMFSVGYRMKD